MITYIEDLNTTLRNRLRELRIQYVNVIVHDYELRLTEVILGSGRSPEGLGMWTDGTD